MVRSRRTAENRTGAAANGIAAAATATVACRPTPAPNSPPAAAPSGMVPQMRKRLVAFIRASIGPMTGSGGLSCTWSRCSPPVRCPAA
jgi:hypothetical protein